MNDSARSVTDDNKSSTVTSGMALFTCPRCGAESEHPMDAREGYCARCHDWTRESGLPQLYFDREGTPIPFRRWLELDTDETRIVRQDMVDRRWLLSTLWVGINMSPWLDTPTIFETILFELTTTLVARYSWRYTTEEMARAGHAAALAQSGTWTELA